MKVFIKTYGCQANINDSEIIAGRVLGLGDKLVSNENRADLIIVNTCTVKNKTQSKILHYIRKHYDLKKIIVTGCLAKTFDFKKEFPDVIVKDLVLEKLGCGVIRRDKDIAIIQISQGCLNKCTYCATRLAKGNLVSYSVDKIKKEFERAVIDGCRRVYLTSQDNGCYGKDIGTNLPELLRELVKVEGDYRIRVGMMHPGHVVKFVDDLIEVYQSPKIQKFIHISVQSGSDSVLKKMRRGHSVADFKKIVSKFRVAFPRSEFPDSTIATDIIVGYPSESESDFEKTVELVEEVKPEVLNVSGFSSRAGTVAAKLKALSSEVVKVRTRKVGNVYLEYRALLE